MILIILILLLLLLLLLLLYTTNDNDNDNDDNNDSNDNANNTSNSNHTSFITTTTTTTTATTMTTITIGHRWRARSRPASPRKPSRTRLGITNNDNDNNDDNNDNDYNNASDNNTTTTTTTIITIIINRINILLSTEVRKGTNGVSTNGVTNTYFFSCTCSYLSCFKLDYECRLKCRSLSRFGKGQMGSALMGSLRFFLCFSTEGLFWVLPLTYIFPKVPGRTFFPQSIKQTYFCSGPISVDPICPQPSKFNYY